MTAVRNSVFWRVCVSVQLVAAILLVTIGSQSAAFHSWVHGDDVACSLAHHMPASEPSEGDTSEDPDHTHADPLEPFCQTGYLLQVALPDLLLDLPRLVDLSEWGPSEFVPETDSFFFHTRAPPVLI